MEVLQITAKTATAFLLPKHYSGRVPSISWAFGRYDKGELLAVCTFGKPASPSLCVGVCGEKRAGNVYELNRLCRVENLNAPLSQFVAECLRRLKAKNLIIVSYSDTAMLHHGYIYQACNFIYTGATKRRTDMYTPTGKHSRHYKHAEQTGLRKVRSAKHRYIYFCARNRYQKKIRLEALKYHIEPYPKGENQNYILGEYIKDVLVLDVKVKPDLVTTPFANE